MSRNTLIYLIAMLAVMPGLCCARDDRTGSPMTLHDCMEYAISHSTKMRIANAAKDDARIARRDAALDSVKLFLASISNPLLLVLWVLS